MISEHRIKMAKNLFACLKELGLNQTQAANKLGIHQSDLSRLKNGDYSHFSLNRITNLIDRLGYKITIEIK